MDFADALNAAMDSAGWTNEKLAVEMNGLVGANQISRWRKRIVQPRLEQYLAIKRALPGFADLFDADASAVA